jgi:hypothetical protein
MSQLIFDQQALVENQMFKYDAFLHSRLTQYTGDGRTLVTYYNINDGNTTTSLGMETHYQILGVDSPLRFNKIKHFILMGFSQLQPQEEQASQTTVRNYGLQGEAYILPGTILPKENDFFIVNHLHMNHLFRVTQVTQDGLNTDGSYKISYALFTTNPPEIDWVDKQTIKTLEFDMQTIGGEDLTPVLGIEDYQLRSQLIKMIDDMIENYNARFYDRTNNCYLLHLNGRCLFDLCGNYFMARNSVMVRDNANGNIVLNPNKCKERNIEELYQYSIYKWIERDAPLSYLDTFKFHTIKGFEYPDSTFYHYGTDVDVMIPNDPMCRCFRCEEYFPMRVLDILSNEQDIRECNITMCRHCEKRDTCFDKCYYLKRFDYVSLLHDYIHGKLTSIRKLSTYTGNQLFDNSYRQDIFLWTPIIIYILKQVLKMKTE